MPTRNRQGQVPEMTFAKQGNSCSLEFLADESAAALTWQDEGVVESFARSTDGVYVLTLRDRYLRISLSAPCVQKNADFTATAIAVDGGAATNTITVYTYLAGTLDDPDVAVTLNFRLLTSIASS
jgi:hypothetical protein